MKRDRMNRDRMNRDRMNRDQMNRDRMNRDRMNRAVRLFGPNSVCSLQILTMWVPRGSLVGWRRDPRRGQSRGKGVAVSAAVIVAKGGEEEVTGGLRPAGGSREEAGGLM